MGEQGGLGMASVLYHQGPGKDGGMREGARPGRSKQGTLKSLSHTVRAGSGHRVATSHQGSGNQLALGHKQAWSAATRTRNAPYNGRDPSQVSHRMPGCLLAVECGVGGEMRPASYGGLSWGLRESERPKSKTASMVSQWAARCRRAGVGRENGLFWLGNLAF